MEPVTAYRPGKMAEVRKRRDDRRRWDSCFRTPPKAYQPPLAPRIRWEAPLGVHDTPPEYAWMADYLGVPYFRWSNT